MKRIHVFAVLGVLAAGMSLSAPAQSVAAPDSAPTQVHSGFYFNATIGPAYSNYDISGGGDTIKVNGAAMSLDLRFGAAVTKHLIVAGVLGASVTFGNPDTTVNGHSVSYNGDNNYFSTSMIGAGLTYYTDSNLFWGVDIGVGKVGLHTDSSGDFNSDNGFAAQARLGKEWWVGDNWALGVVGGIKYVLAHSDGPGYTEDDNAYTTYIGFTVSFN